MPLERHEHVAQVRGGVGLLTGVQCSSPAVAAQAVGLCIERGVIMRAITDGTLQISPPFVIEEHEIAHIAEVLADALDAIPVAG
jgi:adenosylmethionine-8-amino-7-oxononanoate aminotransferase